MSLQKPSAWPQTCNSGKEKFPFNLKESFLSRSRIWNLWDQQYLQSRTEIFRLHWLNWSLNSINVLIYICIKRQLWQPISSIWIHNINPEIHVASIPNIGLTYESYEWSRGSSDGNPTKLSIISWRKIFAIYPKRSVFYEDFFSNNQCWQ